MSKLRRFSLCVSLALVVPSTAFADSLAFSSSRSVGCLDVTGTVSLTTPAPVGGAVFTPSVNSASLVVPASVTVPEGASTASFLMQSSQVAVDTFVTVTLTGPSPLTAIVRRSLTLTPSSPVGISATPRVGNNSGGTGTVSMTCAAPDGGLAVALVSSNAALVVPPTVNVAAGQSSGVFSFTTGQVADSTAVSITANRGGVNRSTTVTVKPATVKTLGFTFSVPVGGDGTTGVVTLDFPAGAGGDVVSVSSVNPSVAAPAVSQLTVGSGSLTGSFTVTTSPVLVDTAVLFTATLNGVSRTATLTVRKNRIESLGVTQKVVSECRSVDAVITLRSAAPAGGLTVTVSTDRPDLILLSTAVVTVPSGFQEATFTINPAAPIVTAQAANVTAVLDGQSPSAPITVALSLLRTSSVGCE